MADILNLISDAERLEFSQNLSVARPAYIGDRIFPDQKTENIKAEYLRLAAGATIPVMATVHAFDTEAEIGSRPVFDKTEVEAAHQAQDQPDRARPPADRKRRVRR